MGLNKVSPSHHLKMETVSFWNAVFSSCLEIWMMDEVHKPTIFRTLKILHSMCVPKFNSPSDSLMLSAHNMIQVCYCEQRVKGNEKHIQIQWII
jgi:hypothetical protein